MILRFKFMHNLWSMDSIFLIPFPEIKFDLQIANQTCDIGTETTMIDFCNFCSKTPNLISILFDRILLFKSKLLTL